MHGRDIVPILTTIAAVACASPASPDRSGPLPITRLEQAVPSLGAAGFAEATAFVIRDRAAWQSTWNRIYSGRSDVPPLPPVDFSTEMIAAVAMGAQPSSGYSVTVTTATETNGDVKIEAMRMRPGPGCVTLTVITYPMDLARLPRRDGAVSFTYADGSSRC